MPSTAPAALKYSNLNVEPTEAWPGQLVNASLDVSNTGNESISYLLPFSVNGVVNQTVEVQLAAGASETVTATFNESSIGTYQLTAGGQSNTINIVPTGEYTLHYISTEGGFPFTLDGVPEVSPFSGLVTAGPHTITVPAVAKITVAGWGLVSYDFSSWNSGSTSLTQTINVQGETYAVTNYVRQGSCPSL